MAGQMFPTYDYETELSDIARRQKIADAMQATALSPMEMPRNQGQMASKASWLGPIAKVLQAYMGYRQGEGLKDEQNKVQERYKADLSSGVEKYMKTSTGYTTPVRAGDEGPVPESVIPGDPKRAMLDAIAGNHPVLRQMGLDQFKAQFGKGKGGEPLDLKTMAGMSTPESVMAAPNDPSKWKPKVELKSAQPGEVMFDSGGNVRTPGAPAGGPTGSGMAADSNFRVLSQGPGWDIIQDKGGDIYQRSPTGVKKVDNAPKVTNHTTLNNKTLVAGQKAGMETWAKEAAKTVGELNDAARQGTKLMAQLNQLEALTSGGTHGGPLADAAVFVAGLAKQAGMNVDQNKLANSQTFSSVATQAWAALMQQNGGARGLVKEESEKLAQSLPSLVQTPQGRQQIIAVLRQAAKQDLANAKRASAEFGEAVLAEDPRKFTNGLSATIAPGAPPSGPVPGGAAPKKPSVSNW